VVITARHFTGTVHVFGGVRSYHYDREGLSFQYRTPTAAPIRWLSAAEFERVDIEPEEWKARAA